MVKIKAKEICTVVKGSLLTGNYEQEITGVAIDSRQVEPGDMFVALPGENTDGHLFVQAAFGKGAVAALVRENTAGDEQHVVIQVADPLDALQDLAAYHRQLYKLPVIGVTGSNGKTTTKDMIAAVLGEKYAILKTAGNYNNDLGLPLTLLTLNSHHQVAVLEMGMRGLGQIQRLVKIARPNIGVLTNIGMTHLELLGTREKIAQAKEELIIGLPDNGIAVLNGEDLYCLEIGKKFKGKKIYYGFQAKCDVQGEEIIYSDFSVNFRVKYAQESFPVKLPLPGEFNVLNALAAVAVGLEIGLEPFRIQAGLAKVELSRMRLQQVTGSRGELIINDAYNANPDSMISSLKILANLPGKRKVAVLGDMYELGDYCKSGHRLVGAEIADLKIDLLVTVGKLAVMIGNEAKLRGLAEHLVKHFDSLEEAVTYLMSVLSGEDLVLVKGSRGMGMEKIVNRLQSV